MSDNEKKAQKKGGPSGDAAPDERLLALRKSMNAKRPRFVRPESWRHVRLKPMWRKPKGLDNKVRQSIKGWPPLVRVGYRGPTQTRNLNSKGLHEVLVHNVVELEGLVPGRDVVRMGGTVGGRKRKAILDRSKELGLYIVNPRGIRYIEPKE